MCTTLKDDDQYIPRNEGKVAAASTKSAIQSHRVKVCISEILPERAKKKRRNHFYLFVSYFYMDVVTFLFISCSFRYALVVVVDDL